MIKYNFTIALPTELIPDKKSTMRTDARLLP